MKKIRLTIGGFSKLCYVTVKTLRHYEKRGLLIPHEVDEWTGYRYYEVEQMEEMARIKELKSLGLSLEEIKDLFDEGLARPNGDLLAQKIAQTRSRIEELRHRLHALQSLQNVAVKKEQTMSEITIKPLPGGIVCSWRSHLKSYAELGPALLAVVQPEMQRLGCVCPPETAYCFTVDYNCHHTPGDIDLEYCEIVAEKGPQSSIVQFKELPLVPTAVCINHHGGYDSFGGTMAQVFRYIEENHWKVLDHPRFNYIHGVWDCDNVADWLTEVQIPVEKEA